MPYFLFFELLGAVIEVLGIPVVLIAWFTGALSVTFFVLFLAVSVLLALIISIWIGGTSTGRTWLVSSAMP